MKTLELFEKNLSVSELNNVRYDGKRVELFLSKVKNKKSFELTPDMQNKLGVNEITIDPAEYDKIVKILNKELPVTTEIALFGSNKTIKISNLQKTREYIFTASGEGSDFNAGNVSEGLLSLALAAKFIKKFEDINEQNILDLIGFIKANNLISTMAGKTAKIALGKILLNTEIKWNENRSDKLDLLIVLALNDFMVMLNPEKIIGENKLKGLLRSAVKYVNSNNNITKALEYIRDDKKVNNVTIEAKGLDDQKGTKIDVETMVDGKPVGLSLSLKTSSGKTFGQIGGATYDNINTFFTELFQISLPATVKSDFEKDALAAVTTAYEFVFGKIKKELSGHNINSEARFIDRLSDGIKFFATRNEDIYLVSLSDKPTKAEYYELEFNQILKKLENIDLGIIWRGDINPTFIITANGVELIKARFKRESSASGKIYGRNYVESGPALKYLASTDPADWSKLDS